MARSLERYAAEDRVAATTETLTTARTSFYPAPRQLRPSPRLRSRDGLSPTMDTSPASAAPLAAAPPDVDLNRAGSARMCDRPFFEKKGRLQIDTSGEPVTNSDRRLPAPAGCWRKLATLSKRRLPTATMLIFERMTAHRSSGGCGLGRAWEWVGPSRAGPDKPFAVLVVRRQRAEQLATLLRAWHAPFQGRKPAFFRVCLAREDQPATPPPSSGADGASPWVFAGCQPLPLTSAGTAANLVFRLPLGAMRPHGQLP